MSRVSVNYAMTALRYILYPFIIALEVFVLTKSRLHRMLILIPAVINALDSGDIRLATFDAHLVKTEVLSKEPDVEELKGDDGHIHVLTSVDWKDTYPNEYATWARNSENDGQTDYLEDYPYLVELYAPYGFSKDYMSARGHTFDLDDIRETLRVGEATKSSCWTCKTPCMTAMVLEEGDTAYGKPFALDSRRHLGMPPYGVAIRSSSKKLYFQGF